MIGRSRSGGPGVLVVSDAQQSAEDDTLHLRWTDMYLEVSLSVLPILPAEPASPCEGGGLVNLAADPVDGEPLATSRTPLIWSVLHLDDGDIALSYLPWSDPTTYHAGRKEPRILTMGRPRQAMSDRFGGQQTSSLEMTVADIDRRFRGRMRAETFLNREWSVWMADNAVRKAEGAARRIGHYAIVDYQPIGDLTYRFVGEDFIGAEVSHFFAEQPLDLPVFSRKYFPQLKRDLDGVVIPPYYGNVSDESLPTSADGPVVLDPTQGISGFNDGDFPDFGWADDLPGNRPIDLVVTDGGGGTFAAGDYWLLWSAVIAGEESLPFPLAGDGTSITIAANRTIIGSGTAVTGATAYRWYLSDKPVATHDHINQTLELMKETTSPAVTFTGPDDGQPYLNNPSWAVVIARMPDGLTIPQRTITNDTGAPQYEGFVKQIPYPDRPVRIAWDALPGAVEYWIFIRQSAREGTSFGSPQQYSQKFVVDGATTSFDYTFGLVGESVEGLPGSETELGAVPCRYVGEWPNPDGVTRSAFVVAFGTMGNVQSLFGSDGQTPTPHRVKVADALYGSVVFCPRKTGWQYPTNYVEVVSSTADPIWLTMVFVDPGHPIAVAAKDGTIELTANVCGYTTTSDGSDETISSGFRQALHFLTNFGPRADGAWRAGDWKQIPTRQGVPIYRSSSFEDCKDQSELIVDGGFECAWGVGVEGPAPKLFELLAGFAINLFIRWIKNEHGQLGMRMLDLNADSAAAFSDRAYDPADGIGGIPQHAAIEVTPDTQGIVNWINWVYKKNYIAAVTNPTPEAEELLPPKLQETPDWYSGRLENHSDTSYVDINNIWKPVDIEFSMHRDGRAPTAIVGLYLRLWSTPIDKYRIPSSLLGADVTLGDVVTVTHHAGAGAAGAVERRVWLTAREVDAIMAPDTPTTFDVWLEGDDITDVDLGGSPSLGSP